MTFQLPRDTPWKLATLGLAAALLGGLIHSTTPLAPASADTVPMVDGPSPPDSKPAVAIRPLTDGRYPDLRLIELDYRGRRYAFLESMAGGGSRALVKVEDYQVSGGTR